jgi:plasmid stability protein
MAREMGVKTPLADEPLHLTRHRGWLRPRLETEEGMEGVAVLGEEAVCAQNPHDQPISRPRRHTGETRWGKHGGPPSESDARQRVSLSLDTEPSKGCHRISGSSLESQTTGTWVLPYREVFLHNGGVLEEFPDMATLNVKNFPPDLYEWLKEKAAAERRSVARQIVHIVEKAVEAEEPLSILKLRGLGKEAWRGVDAADYVAEERGSWD